MNNKILDLSILMQDGMPAFPGDLSPSITHTVKYVESGYNNYVLNSGMHIGTHMDGPLHMIDGGRKLCDFPINKFFGRGHLIDAREKEINSDLLENVDISIGDIVLIYTSFEDIFGSEEYYNSYPDIQESFADVLINKGVSIVGMDSPSPDRHPYRIHKMLLGNDILIIENLTNLKSLINVRNFNVIALPLKIDADSASCRVVAEFY
ncbi:MAG: cyclase family protein [Candidatus Kapabacteria bacterium]|nr:cyclase family protein [Ignavibacteriota bacterium]MCW5885835.1 cyclase family protein [Candidatus Kapabacteria bacterium]